MQFRPFIAKEEVSGLVAVAEEEVTWSRDSGLRDESVSYDSSDGYLLFEGADILRNDMEPLQNQH